MQLPKETKKVHVAEDIDEDEDEDDVDFPKFDCEVGSTKDLKQAYSRKGKAPVGSLSKGKSRAEAEVIVLDEQPYYRYGVGKWF